MSELVSRIGAQSLRAVVGNESPIVLQEIAAQNQRTIQTALSAGGSIQFNVPGTYPITDEEFLRQNQATVEFVPGVLFSIDGTVVAPKGTASRTLVNSGVWMIQQGLFRLRLVGTGALVVDSCNALGVVTSGVFMTSVSGATNQIEFPYLGDDAVEMRLTFPSTLEVEVLR